MREEIFIGIITFIVMLLFVGLISWIYYDKYAMDEACKRIGFVEAIRGIRNFDVCKDSDGNLHYVEFISDGLFNYKAKEISVGGVRIANE